MRPPSPTSNGGPCSPKSLWLLSFVAWAVACGNESDSLSRQSADERPVSSADTSAKASAGASASGSPSEVSSSEAADLALPCFQGCADEANKQRPSWMPGPHCPVEMPEKGTPCTRALVICSYGDSPNPYCREDVQCGTSGWQPREPSAGVYQGQGCPTEVPEGWCPSGVPSGRCTPIDGNPSCAFGDAANAVKCFCPFSLMSLPEWECFGPPLDERCPAEVPLLGSGCSTAGVHCEYFPTCGGHSNSSVLCSDGQWEEGTGVQCPL
jgi:hypothetical protein